MVNGRIAVPAGKTPVVMTFDDSTKEQLAWDDQKRPKPNTAIAIMLEFAKQNPGFEPAGTFYVNRDPFAGDPRGAEMLRWLHANGFEIGNHTYDQGSWNGMSYRHRGVMLVGAEPAPSPFTKAFKPVGIPRIRTSPPDARDPLMGSTYWLDDLKANPGKRYVSDGNPDTISFPRDRADALAPRFRPRANPY